MVSSTIASLRWGTGPLSYHKSCKKISMKNKYRGKLNAHKVSIWLKKLIQKNKIFFICINTEL